MVMSAATPVIIEEIDEETGEIKAFLVTKKGRRVFRSFQESRAYRYFLKTVANKILSDETRLKACSRLRAPGRDVEIIKSFEHQKCSFSGLVRCGSPWGCPVCASQISERRKAEIKTAIASARMMGWDVHLMTCTVPHGLGDDVNDIRSKLTKAWSRVIDSRAGKDFKKLFGVEGTIRALEVTHGSNGFHPHYHVLVFTNRLVTSMVLKECFFPLWQKACIKTGLGEPSSKAFDVRNGSHADEYVSKGALGLEKSTWGLPDEMTKGHTKLSRSETGSTPFGLLENYALNACTRSRGLFWVYYQAFKGSRQLHWSKGLKNKLSIQDYTDEELIHKEEDHCFLLATLTFQQWQSVLKTESHSALLDVAERSPDEIQNFLQSLTV